MGTIQQVDFLNVNTNPALRRRALTEESTRQHLLRRIGVFELIDGVYVGHVATLNFRCKAVIKENPYRKVEADPGYILEHMEGEAFYPELGFGWEKKTDGQSIPFMSVHIDDPAFPKTIVAVLVRGTGNLYHLYWDRITITDDDIEKAIVTEESIPYTSVLRPVDKMTPYLISIYPMLADQWGFDPD